MSKPPAAVRYLVLLAALLLLATAVCSKTKNSSPTQPVAPMSTGSPSSASSPLDAGSADAGPSDATIALPQLQEEPFFPASKSGGMF